MNRMVRTTKKDPTREVIRQILRQDRKAARDRRIVLDHLGLVPKPVVEGRWYRLKDKVSGVDEDTRVVVAFCDQDSGGDTGIVTTSYFCIAEGDYDLYDDARWMPVPRMPWEKEYGGDDE
jgi:hypothetical protein